MGRDFNKKVALECLDAGLWQHPRHTRDIIENHASTVRLNWELRSYLKKIRDHEDADYEQWAREFARFALEIVESRHEKAG